MMTTLRLLVLVVIVTVTVVTGGVFGDDTNDEGGLINVYVAPAEGAVLIAETREQDDDHWTNYWFIRFLLNLFGYGTILFPCWLLIRYLRSINFLERRGDRGCVYKSVKMCVFGQESITACLEEGLQPSVKEMSNSKRGALLMFCTLGLQVSYLSWGLLQERIMAHEYSTTSDTDEPGEKFTNSQFLVFMNRILAFVAAGVIMVVRRQPQQVVPMYKYSYCSLSNILSSWCQYEALKFVSFPTQVLAKASKIIPVMVMGKLVSQRVYEYYEYVTALMISGGMAIFLMSQGVNDGHMSNTTTFSGLIILAGYMTFDSFTSNWQGELFKQYKMSSIQMMFGVNLFSCIFTSGSLIQQGGFVESFMFMLDHRLFVFHIILLSICSATGQLFIFYTISQFGPIIFVIIMTLRQMFAILLSCFVYSHPVTITGALGVLVVFLALFLRIYAQNKVKKTQRLQTSTNISKI